MTLYQDARRTLYGGVWGGGGCSKVCKERGGGVSKGASKGQVWTCHCAPATPAFTWPSSLSQFIASLTDHLNVHQFIVLLLTLPDLGKTQSHHKDFKGSGRVAGVGA